MRGRGAGLAVAVATLAFAGSANAAQVGIAYQPVTDIGVPGGYVVEYVAAPGEINRPTVTVTSADGLGGKVVTFHDPWATFSDNPPTHTYEGGWTAVDSPCTIVATAPHYARCVLPDPRWVAQEAQVQSLDITYATNGNLFGVNIDLGDGDDSYTPTAPGPTDKPFLLGVSGGAGNDLITTGPWGTAVDAGAGDDTIYAGDGQHSDVACGDGTDQVRSRDAGDTIAADCEDVTAP